jgi:hypothetical protein
MAILGYKDSVNELRGQGLEHWLETRGLAGWLEIATHELDAASRRRIAVEIEAHYAEAVAAHIAAGETESKAHAAALSELGDPIKASWKFQKNYLTDDEAKGIKWVEDTATKPFFSIRALWIDAAPFAALVFLLFHATSRFHFPAEWVIVLYAGFRLFPRLLFTLPFSRRFLRRRLAVCYMVSTAAYLLALSSTFCFYDQDPWSLLNSTFFFFCMSLSWRPGLMTWNKLRKLDDLPGKAHEA